MMNVKEFSMIEVQFVCNYFKKSQVVNIFKKLLKNYKHIYHKNKYFLIFS